MLTLLMVLPTGHQRPVPGEACAANFFGNACSADPLLVELLATAIFGILVTVPC